MTSSPTAETEAVGRAISGLKPSRSTLVNSWTLDEARGEAEAAGQTSLSSLTRALLKLESSSEPLKRSTSGATGPSSGGDESRDGFRRFACESGGRDPSRDYESRKRAAKRRDSNAKKAKRDERSVKGRKREDREAAMATRQRGRSDDSGDDDASNSEDEQPARVAQLKKKKRRAAAADDERRRARVALAATTRRLATSALL